MRRITSLTAHPNTLIKTKDPNFSLSVAKPSDAGLVLNFMQKLGAYQKMADKIVATESGLRSLIATEKGEAVFGRYNGETVAFAYFCQTSSAFIGQTSLYIDGFFVDESMRFKGLGKIMMAYLSKIAVERDCKRLEWACLDWNQPTIDFYKGLGAYSVDGMTIYRFTPDVLKANAALF